MLSCAFAQLDLGIRCPKYSLQYPTNLLSGSVDFDHIMWSYVPFESKSTFFSLTRYFPDVVKTTAYVNEIFKIGITKTCLYNFDPLNPTFV